MSLSTRDNCQWSLSTRDKLYNGASLQGTSCTASLQGTNCKWSLSTRDKLHSGASLQGTSCSGASLQGTSSIVEPLYKGQVVQWCLSTRDKLYSSASLQGTNCLSTCKGQVVQWSLFSERASPIGDLGVGNGRKDFPFVQRFWHWRFGGFTTDNKPYFTRLTSGVVLPWILTHLQRWELLYILYNWKWVEINMNGSL